MVSHIPMVPRVRYPVPNLEQWTQPEYYTQLDASFDPVYDVVAGEFTTKDLRFEQSIDLDVAWGFDQELGSELVLNHVGFVNARQELAVKEMPVPTRNLYQFSPDGRPIPEEAIIQTMLQRKDCVPVLQMRGLSIVTSSTGLDVRLRYYLEYCPYGDLYQLLDRYSDIVDANPNSREHIPEPFLWQLLLNFAEVMVAMEQGPFEHPVAKTLDDSPYILHFDVKLDNMMLQIPDAAEIVKEYPSCKVGDWGLAKLMSLTDVRNSSKFKSRGTRQWYPPVGDKMPLRLWVHANTSQEQYNRNRFGEDWVHQPPWRNSDFSNSHPYVPAHSVFTFASIIFRLMTLDGGLDLLEDMIKLASIQEAEVHSNGFRLFESDFLDKDSYGRPTPYSQLLKDTITNCMNLNPAARPTALCIEQIARGQCLALSAQQYFGSVNTFPLLDIEHTYFRQLSVEILT